MPTILAAVPSNYLAAIHAAAPRTWHLMACQMPHLLERIEAVAPDGVLAHAHEPQQRDQLAGLNDLPVVNTSCGLADPGCARAAPDSRAAGGMAAEHLLQRGFTHLGILSLRDRWYAHERRSAIIERCRHAECSFSTFEWPADQALPADRARVWWQGLPPGHALVAINDRVATDWLAQSWRPEQAIAMVSIDNNEDLCLTARPALSSVHWSVPAIADQACQLLQRQLAGQRDCSDIRVPPVGVIVRDSSEIWAVDDPVVSAALQWIAEHACEDIDAADVASAMGQHRRALERAFARWLPHGPRWFIEFNRIERAKQLLETTTLAVGSVALHCGFQSPAWFGARFRRATGRTPGRWRREFG